VTRGGYGTLVELAALKKPAIFFPLPGHQERNTAIVHEHDAGVVLDQEKTNAHGLIATIELLFAQEHTRSEIGDRLHECIPPLKKDILKRVLEGCLGEK
jgi:UDP-N-acetylglucosamine:LPS N-acetylglucosamine transferase